MTTIVNTGTTDSSWSPERHVISAATKAQNRTEARQRNFTNHVKKPLAKVAMLATFAAGGTAGAAAGQAAENWYVYTHAPVAQPAPNGIRTDVLLGEPYKVGDKVVTPTSLTDVAKNAGVSGHDWHRVRDMLVTQVHQDGYPDANVLPVDLTLHLPASAKLGDHYNGE